MDNSNRSHAVQFIFPLSTSNIVSFVSNMIHKSKSTSTFFYLNPTNSFTDNDVYLWYGGYGSGANNTEGYFIMFLCY